MTYMGAQTPKDLAQETVNLSTFRRRLLRLLLWQSLIFGVGLSLFLWAYEKGYFLGQLLVLLATLIALAIFSLRSRTSIYRLVGLRLKSVFPEAKSFLPLSALLLSPILGMLLLLFLALWQKPLGTPKILKVSQGSAIFVFTLLFPLLVLAPIVLGTSPRIATGSAFWVLNPSSYFLINEFYEVQRISNFSNRLSEVKGDSAKMDVELSHFLDAKPVSIQTVVLGSSIYFSKEKSLELKTGGLNKILKQYDNSSPQIMRFNLLSWLSPSSLVEISLLSLVDLFERERVGKAFAESKKEFLTSSALFITNE